MPPDFPARGLARFREHIYYQLLECGLQVAPLACTGSGDAAVPLGSMRTYAWKGTSTGDPTEIWWQAIRNGQVLDSGGPVLMARVNNHLPGTVFRPQQEPPFQLEFSATLHTREKISYLEIIQDGQVTHTVPLDKWVAANGRLPPVQFEQSGWALLRAVIDAGEDYRYAMSGPFYVQLNDEPHISRKAAGFFRDWATARRDALRQKAPASDLKFHEAAVRYWNQRESQANAD